MGRMDDDIDIMAELRHAMHYPPKHQRKGQAMFNRLHDLRPDLANQVRGTLDDPFYNERHMGSFMLWVQEHI